MNPDGNRTATLGPGSGPAVPPEQVQGASPAGAGSVLYVVNSLGTGGAEVQVVELARRFRARGWEVGVATLLGTDHQRSRLEEAGIPWYCLGMRKGWPDPRAVVELARIVRRRRPDVLHSHMVHANFLARAARPLCRPPVLITTAHSTNEGARWRYLVYRLTAGLADGITIVSEAGARRHRELGATPPDRLLVIPNGVDLARFAPDPEVRAAARREEGLDGRFCWLAVGRYEASKDYPAMLRALRTVVDRRPDALLLIAGDGPLRIEAERRIDEHGLRDHVRCLGVRRDVPRLMNAADAYLMSSAWEGLPIVLIEAAASGLPAVATAVGGVPEVIEAGRTGLLAPPGDPAELAAAMLATMALPEAERRSMGRAARELAASRFDIEAVVDRWNTMYQSLRAGGRAGRGRG